MTKQTLVSNIILCSQGEERRQFLDWLEQPNELIAKSVRFEQLVNHACMCFYKKPLNSVSEDTINFIRRSIHDMIRSKSTKDHLHAQLLSTPSLVQQPMDAMMNPYEYGDGSMYVPNHMEDNERIIHVDLMGGMRQPTERELEMVNQGAVQSRGTENIALQQKSSSVIIQCFCLLRMQTREERVFSGSDFWLGFQLQLSSATRFNHGYCM